MSQKQGHCPHCPGGRSCACTGILSGDFALPARAGTRLAGLFLAIRDLIALGIPDLVTGVGYPSTPTCVVPVWRITGIG